jgi:hypothetical protein
VRGNRLFTDAELLIDSFRRGEPVGEGPGLVGESLLQADDFLVADGGLPFGVRGELVRLLAGFERGLLPQVVGVALGLVDDAPGLLAGLFDRLNRRASALGRGPEHRGACDGAHKEGAECRDQSRRCPHKGLSPGTFVAGSQSFVT